MPADLDPIRFSDQLRIAMTRYITTAASVAPSRAPRLARELRERLVRERIVEGPFVESLPDSSRGARFANSLPRAGWTLDGRLSMIIRMALDCSNFRYISTRLRSSDATTTTSWPLGRDRERQRHFFYP